MCARPWLFFFPGGRCALPHCAEWPLGAAPTQAPTGNLLTVPTCYMYVVYMVYTRAQTALALPAACHDDGAATAASHSSWSASPACRGPHPNVAGTRARRSTLGTSVPTFPGQPHSSQGLLFARPTATASLDVGAHRPYRASTWRHPLRARYRRTLPTRHPRHPPSMAAYTHAASPLHLGSPQQHPLAPADPSALPSFLTCLPACLPAGHAAPTTLERRLLPPASYMYILLHWHHTTHNPQPTTPSQRATMRASASTRAPHARCRSRATRGGGRDVGWECNGYPGCGEKEHQVAGHGMEPAIAVRLVGGGCCSECLQ